MRGSTCKRPCGCVILAWATLKRRYPGPYPGPYPGTSYPGTSYPGTSYPGTSYPGLVPRIFVPRPRILVTWPCTLVPRIFTPIHCYLCTPAIRNFVFIPPNLYIFVPRLFISSYRSLVFRLFYYHIITFYLFVTFYHNVLS